MKPKIVLIGGASPYFETVIDELALQKELAGSSVVLYDVNLGPMRLIRTIGKRVLEMTGAKLKRSMTTDPARAFDGANIECKAIVGNDGARPVHAGELALQAARWSLAQIHTQELMVDAAVEGSRQKALSALACDPMMQKFHEVEPLFDAIVAAQGDRLARFTKAGPRAKRQ